MPRSESFCLIEDYDICFKCHSMILVNKLKAGNCEDVKACDERKHSYDFQNRRLKVDKSIS